MTCKQFDTMLVDFVDGNLSQKQKKEMRAHAETCPTCKAILADYQNMIGKLNDMPVQKCPDFVVDTVLDAVPDTRKSFIRTLSERFSAGMAWKVSFAAALAILVVSIVLFHPSQPPVIDVNQQYTEEEIAQATRDVKLAFGYFNHYAKKAEKAIEEQVLAKGVVEPVSSTIKIAFKPILNGGSK